MNNSNKIAGIKLCIISMSLVQMGANGISAIIANLVKEFPGYAVSTIQFLMTFPNIFVTICCMMSPWLLKYFTKKKLVEYGLILVALSGILSFLFHSDIRLLFGWASLLGIGIGLVMPVAPLLISDYFIGERKSKMMGWQTSSANFGGMLMTLFGGILALISWKFNYLIYLISLIGLVLTILYLPKDEKQCYAVHLKNISFSKGSWCYFLLSLFFLILFNIGPTNLSLFVNEKNIGGASVAGTAVTLMLLGGMLMGMFFGKLYKKGDSLIVPLGFILLGIGLFIIGHAKMPIQVFIGSLLSGTSISCVMPFCMLKASSQQGVQNITFATALVLAASNLGTFLTPLITQICIRVFNLNGTASRIHYLSLMIVMIGCIIYINIKFRAKRSCY